MAPAQTRSQRVVELGLELRALEDEIDALYWIFTRTARGQPPVLVRPDLYARRAAVEVELRQLRRATPRIESGGSDHGR